MDCKIKCPFTAQYIRAKIIGETYRFGIKYYLVRFRFIGMEEKLFRASKVIKLY